MNTLEKFNSTYDFYAKVYEERIDVYHRLTTINYNTNHNEDTRALLHISWQCINFIKKECAKRYIEYHESEDVDLVEQFAHDYKQAVENMQLSKMEMLESTNFSKIIPFDSYEFVLDYIIEKYPFSIHEKYFDNVSVLFESILDINGSDCSLLPILEKALSYEFPSKWYESFRSAFVKLLLFTGESKELYDLARRYQNHPVDYMRHQMEDLLEEENY